MSLIALQRDFRRHLLDGPGAVEGWIAPGALAGLHVYHNAYRVQLTDCLAETYPQLQAWLGGSGFVDAARHHIEHMPPSGWTLGVYGAGFDRTLAGLHPDDPEIAELATLEWMLAEAFAGADAVAQPPGAIAGVDWDKARLRFVPTLRIESARTNAGAIWSALSAGAAPPAAAILPEPAAMLVWRQDFTPCFRTVEKVECEALHMLASGKGFADLCGWLVAAHGEAVGVAHAGAMLGQWFADGLVAGCEEGSGA
ncbi:HvfC/BufC N-terminal domain-containing protein [Sphingomonas alpina]|uniref:Putative DNA-binding domain-containing protein n=1 Tax=Sphingomonas alpina TaxID=653931 RepID=A0A7H0LFJ9_9SPHN|nr:DNA-binding domain-containing protein [Sphingomonas alpina]QNQ08452.1 putative DNA-binding domain-containing protein [Sphingomonas alpina]